MGAIRLRRKILKLLEKKCEEGDLNPHGFYPTSPSN